MISLNLILILFSGIHLEIEVILVKIFNKFERNKITPNKIN